VCDRTRLRRAVATRIGLRTFVFRPQRNCRHSLMENWIESDASSRRTDGSSISPSQLYTLYKNLHPCCYATVLVPSERMFVEGTSMFACIDMYNTKCVYYSKRHDHTGGTILYSVHSNNIQRKSMRARATAINQHDRPRRHQIAHRAAYSTIQQCSSMERSPIPVL
jgi:hypothetical protein